MAAGKATRNNLRREYFQLSIPSTNIYGPVTNNNVVLHVGGAHLQVGHARLHVASAHLQVACKARYVRNFSVKKVNKCSLPVAKFILPFSRL